MTVTSDFLKARSTSFNDSSYDATLCNTLFTWRVYTHPAIPITGTPLSMETPPKSANSDQGLMKKLKGFGGLAMSIGNGHTDIFDDMNNVDTGDSSDGSDGNTVGANQTPRKKSCERTPAISMTLFFTKCHILMNNRVVLRSQLSF
ncbi:hypothetical protein Ahy_B09g097820 [Arachis hypogaea]|uniref:Uncharacterized protein n=1 Tax=Arachis hypogaea TaxID=3818 RepID=A0A444XQG7_ARAHY|nr:hypothetical protein Ahy_B09g097820 [Arachis hypogaea]